MTIYLDNRVETGSKEKFRSDLMRAWAIVFAIVAILIGYATLASAQTAITELPTPAGFVSWCFTNTKGLEKPAREVIELQCKLEQTELRRQIREADKPKLKASDPIGIAAENKAVTTVTFRDSTGDAFEGSKGWASHEEKMAEIAAGPHDPCLGKWAWFTCSSVVVAGYNGGVYEGVNTSGGYVTPYGVGGHGREGVRTSGGGRVQRYSSGGSRGYSQMRGGGREGVRSSGGNVGRYGHSRGGEGVNGGGNIGRYGRPGAEGTNGGGNIGRLGRPGAEGVNGSGNIGRLGPSGPEGVNGGGNTGRLGPSGPEGVNGGGNTGPYGRPGAEGVNGGGNTGRLGPSGPEGVNGGGGVRPYNRP